jgi:hypothetical protein
MICSNKISRGSFDSDNLDNLAVYPNTYCPAVPSGDIPLECCRSPITGISDVELNASYFANFPELPTLQNEITKGSQFQDVYKRCLNRQIPSTNIPTNQLPNNQLPNQPNPNVQQPNQLMRKDLLAMLIIFILLYFASSRK